MEIIFKNIYRFSNYSITGLSDKTKLSLIFIYFRLPPEDKLYERELQLALELSVEEATKSQSSSSSQEQSVSDEFVSDSPPANHNSPPCLDRVAPLSLNEVNESSDAPNLKSEGKTHTKLLLLMLMYTFKFATGDLFAQILLKFFICKNKMHFSKEV